MVSSLCCFDTCSSASQYALYEGKKGGFLRIRKWGNISQSLDVVFCKMLHFTLAILEFIGFVFAYWRNLLHFQAVLRIS